MQLILFVARFVLPLNVWAGYLASWLVHGRTVGIDDSHTIFNVDCRVCPLVHSIACVRFNVWCSTPSTPPSGQSIMIIPKPASTSFDHGLIRNMPPLMVSDLISQWKFVSLPPTIYGSAQAMGGSHVGLELFSTSKCDTVLFSLIYIDYSSQDPMVSTYPIGSYFNVSRE
jgi:hypothetical protein